MNTSQAYITISIFALLLVAIILIIKRKQGGEKRLSCLVALAFAFVLAGIIFGDDRLIGYSLIGIGLILAIVDIIRSRKTKE